MAYIVNDDIVDRVGSATAAQLSADSGDTPDSDVLTEVRNSAEGEVNGYLAVRYAVPVDLSAHADLTATLKGFALDVAVYRLYGRRSPVPENVRRMRDDAIAWLTKVSKGEIVLPAAATPASTTANQPTAAWGSKAQNAATMRDL